MKSGDIILMHGDFADSWIIEGIEDSIWTHSGTILLAEDVGLKGKAPDYLYWESNSLTNLTDVILNKTKTGPMLVDLDARVIGNAKNYKEVKMAYVQLNITRTPAMFQSIVNFIPTVHEATFPSDKKMLYQEIQGRLFRKQSNKDQIFCSELVAGTYQAVGWMNTDWPWNAYEPGDFTKKDKVDLQLGATFSKPLQFDPLS